jgi:hypothetical protein
MATIRLNDDIENKLSILTEFEKASKSDIIKKAIIEYFKQQIPDKTPYESGKDLFGKYGSDTDLSTTYKKKLKGKLNEKHSH